MPRPSDLTPEQRAAEGQLLARERRDADREDAPLFAKQAFFLEASEDELRATLPEEKATAILAYREQQNESPLHFGGRFISSALFLASQGRSLNEPRAAGGSSGNCVLTYENGYVNLLLEWTQEAITISWQYVGITGTSYLIGLFRDADGRNLLTQPFCFGRLDASSWTATADDVGFNPSSQWTLQFILAITPV